MSDQNHPKDRKKRPFHSIVEVLAELPAVSVQPADDSQKTRWESFYELWKEPMTQIAVKVGVPRSRREDLIQEVLLKMMSRWDEFRRPDGARQLLALSCKMMHDKAVDMIRSLGRQHAESLDGVPAEPVDPKVGDPASVAEGKELRDWVSASLECLEEEKPKYAWVLREHFLKERPIKELAAEKGVNEHSVRNLETRALHAMRHLMSGGDAGGETVP